MVRIVNKLTTALCAIYIYIPLVISLSLPLSRYHDDEAISSFPSLTLEYE